MTTHDWVTVASLLRYAIIAATVIYVAAAITKAMRDIATARREAGQAIAAAYDRNTAAIGERDERRRKRDQVLAIVSREPIDARRAYADIRKIYGGGQ